jgi:hypothetical protein
MSNLLFLKLQAFQAVAHESYLLIFGARVALQVHQTSDTDCGQKIELKNAQTKSKKKKKQKSSKKIKTNTSQNEQCADVRRDAHHDRCCCYQSYARWPHRCSVRTQNLPHREPQILAAAMRRSCRLKL